MQEPMIFAISVVKLQIFSELQCQCQPVPHTKVLNDFGYVDN